MNLLSRLKIRTKLASMVALAALTVCAIIALSASLSESRMMNDRIVQMRTAVDLLVVNVVNAPTAEDLESEGAGEVAEGAEPAEEAADGEGEAAEAESESE